jgi:cyanophycinase
MIMPAGARLRPSALATGNLAGVPGPVALVGSGEFLPVMRDTDARLLDGRPQRAVFLPTAAAEEGDERIKYWLDLGTRHYGSMGVEAVPLPVLNRVDADSDWAAGAIAGAGLIYLSGGDPGYLADTLRDSAVWSAIVTAWESGAALAGCSAGACALTGVANHVRSGAPAAGLGLIPHLAVLPHFDLFRARAPARVAALVSSAGDEFTVVGIDEDTALVGGPTRFVVEGRQSVWVYGASGAEPDQYGTGDEVALPAPPRG